jgi:predicted  nucleic acid-binding Zn-ribbon protein
MNDQTKVELKEEIQALENIINKQNKEITEYLDLYSEEFRENSDLNEKINDLNKEIIDLKNTNSSKQYKKIRSAFDRNKSNHRSIVTYLAQNSLVVNGKKLSISYMIREGKKLLNEQE